MGKAQRTRGAVYEREVCKELHLWSGREVKRHIGQARDGGNDITVGRLVVECKRRKTLGTVYSWLRQAMAATKPTELPIVVAREDQGESLVILRLSDFLQLVRPEDAGVR